MYQENVKKEEKKSSEETNDYDSRKEFSCSCCYLCKIFCLMAHGRSICPPDDETTKPLLKKREKSESAFLSDTHKIIKKKSPPIKIDLDISEEDAKENNDLKDDIKEKDLSQIKGSVVFISFFEKLYVTLDFDSEQIYSVPWFQENFQKNIKFLGKGGFGVVISATRKKGGQDSAIKILKSETMEDLNNFMKEAMALHSLHHPNILEFQCHYLNKIDYTKNDKQCSEFQLFIAMEKADKTLDDVLKNKGPNFSSKSLMRLMSDLFKGLNFAHSNKISHNDIKPQNIFICSNYFDNSIVYKLGDWGAGALLKESGTLTSRKIGMGYTKVYTSPEVIQEEEKINFFKSDVYSLGLTFLRCCGVGLGKIKTLNHLEEKEHDKKLEELLQELKNLYFDQEIVSVINKMLSFNPRDRLMIDDDFIKDFCNKDSNFDLIISAEKIPKTMNNGLVAKDLEDKSQNSLESMRLKIVTLGDSWTGKTCILLRYFEAHFSSNLATTSAEIFLFYYNSLKF